MKELTLEERLREMVRVQNLSHGTADAYWMWVRKYLLFARQKRGQWVHPEELRERQFEIWLKHLAVVEDVSANTQNQAFSAICYLYKHVIREPLENVSALRAKRPDAIRDVLDQSELVRLFAELRGAALLAARMMYASSFRIGEVGDVRIKDVYFERKQIIIRSGKGQKGREVGFPEILHDDVRRQVESMRVLWAADRAEGRNGVSLPNRFGEKSPSSHREFAWYYLFSSDYESKCPRTGRLLRHHQDTGHIARQIKLAAGRAGIEKRVTSHCLRHSFATHSIENGVPIHVVQKIMGHTDIRTTERYLHMAKNGVTAAQSPLEAMDKAETLTRSATESMAPLAELLREAQPPRGQQESRPVLRVFAG